MKLELYLDVFPGFDPRYAAAHASPGEKASNAKRWRIVVDIPLYDADAQQQGAIYPEGEEPTT